MKCELKVSAWCKKIKAKCMINGKYCCENCYNLQKKKNKQN